MKYIQYSKILPALTTIIFFTCLIVGFLTDFSGIEDISFYVTAITVSGTSCLTTNVWYMKNSQAEKVAKIKAESYKIIAEERLKYNEAMMKLQKEYESFNEDSQNPMDELFDNAENSYCSSIDDFMDDATIPVDVVEV